MARGISGSLSPGCRWLTDGIFRVGLFILVLLKPDTGYLDRVELIDCLGITSQGCFGITKAFVCLISDLSLHNADMRGKSIFLLFSLRVRISRAEALSLLVTFKDDFSLTLFTFGPNNVELWASNNDGCFSGMGGGGGGGGNLLCFGG